MGHASKTHHHLMAAFERDLAADQPGIATLRHDLRVRFVGALQDRRNFRRRARLEHERGVAKIAIAPFNEIRRHGLRVADRVVLADDADERVERLIAWPPAGLLVGRHGRSALAVKVAEMRARLSRSLMASPRPRSGSGITAIDSRPAAATVLSAAKKFAQASVRSPRRLRLIAGPAKLGASGPKARSASPRRGLLALRRSGVEGA